MPEHLGHSPQKNQLDRCYGQIRNPVGQAVSVWSEPGSAKSMEKMMGENRRTTPSSKSHLPRRTSTLLKVAVALGYILIAGWSILTIQGRINYAAYFSNVAAGNSYSSSASSFAQILMPVQDTPAGGPLEVDAVNPRYFTDGSGRAILLTGAHTWSNFEDNGGSDPPPVFDYTGYLNFLQANNHNFMRLWVWEQSRWAAETSDENYWFNPMTPFQRTGPGNALDGKPKLNLTQFDQTYFDRLRQRVILAGQRGIYVSVMLFNGWSVDPKSPWGGGQNIPWKGHPFNASNNINGINGDPNGDSSGIETETLSLPAVTAIQDAYVRKVVDTVNDLDNVLYEICNECADGSWQSSDSTAWQYHMLDLIHTYEAGQPKQHPVGISQISGDDSALFNSSADWVSIHDSASLDSPYISNGTKVVIVDSDHVCGVCGNRAWAWKSFMNGKNPIFMDPYDGAGYGVGGAGQTFNDPRWVEMRSNLGYILTFANRINLEAMTPHGELSSRGYALANPVSTGAEYLAYLPSGGSVTVNLSAAAGQLNYEWFNPASGATVPGGSVAGGASRAFTTPFSGDAVLYIYSALPTTQTPTATRTNTPSGPTATRTNTPFVPTATRTNTPLSATVTRTSTAPTQTKTATSTLDFSTPTPTSPLTFPTLTSTLPTESSLTPSVTGTLPVTTATSTLTITPIPPGTDPARTLRYCVIGILLTAAIVGTLFYLLWIFRLLRRSA